MADLSFDLAISLARSLTTIKGCSRFEDAINATAHDLVRWCKGAVIGRQIWSPEDQALWLVTEARETWSEWTCTADLRTLFRKKFEPQQLAPERKVFDPGVKPPIDCHRCEDVGTVDGQYCHCVMGREMKALWGDKLLVTARVKSFPKPRVITPAEIEQAERRFHQPSLQKLGVA